jgi:hypothetical protein
MTTAQAVRPATEADFPWIWRLAREHLRELGYVPQPVYREAIAAGEVLVASASSAQAVPGAGFVRFHRRRDGWATVYELCSVRPGAGRALLEAVPAPRRLKAPADLPCNGFYEHLGGVLAATDPGKHRPLNVWEWPPASST